MLPSPANKGFSSIVSFHRSGHTQAKSACRNASIMWKISHRYENHVTRSFERDEVEMKLLCQCLIYISSLRVFFLSSAKCMCLTSDKIGKEEEEEEHIPEIFL